MEKFKEYKNIALLFVLSSLWALHFSLVKLVEADDSPLTILVSLLAVLCALFFVLLLFQNKLFKFTLKKSLFFSVAGMFAYIIPLSVEFVVAPKIEAGILTLIVSVVPVFTLIVIWIFRLLNVTIKLVIGTLSGLAGLLILFYGNNDNTSISIWAVYALIIPLSYAFDAIFMEKFWPRNLDSTQVAFGETTASLIFVIFSILGIIFFSAIGSEICFLIISSVFFSNFVLGGGGSFKGTDSTSRTTHSSFLTSSERGKRKKRPRETKIEQIKLFLDPLPLVSDSIPGTQSIADISFIWNLQRVLQLLHQLTELDP